MLVTRRACSDKHRLLDMRFKLVDERFKEGQDQMGRIDRKVNKLLALAGAILVAVIGPMIEKLL